MSGARLPAQTGDQVEEAPRNTRPHPLLAMTAEPWAHDFLYAMRLLEAHFADKPRLGTARKPAEEMVRLGQTPAVSFPPATLSRISTDGASGQPRMEVRFFGLFGPHGPLPLHLTEYAMERQQNHGDPTFVRFADLFHHRLLLLFYRAWAQAQPTANLDRPHDDRFSAHVAALIGMGTPRHLDREAAPDYAKFYFSGYLAHQARSADGLRAMLAGYLRTQVRIEPFAGQWLELPPAERTRIGGLAGTGGVGALLGAGAVLGTRVFDRQHNFCIAIGPLTLAAFESLLPTGEDSSALPGVQSLVRHYAGLALAWELRLQLAPDEQPATRLGRAGRLGWTTWIGRSESAGGSDGESGGGRLARRPGLPEPILRLRPAARHTAHRNGHGRSTHSPV